MPTVRQLFALLREDVEKEAIEETRKCNGDDFEEQMNNEHQTISSALASSFFWETSEKGRNYWQSIYKHPPLKTSSNE